jgi:hypothetical protein
LPEQWREEAENLAHGNETVKEYKALRRCADALKAALRADAPSRREAAPLPPGAWQPFPDLPVAMEDNGPDGYTLTDLTTGQRRAYVIARPVKKDALKRLRAKVEGLSRYDVPRRLLQCVVLEDVLRAIDAARAEAQS